MMQQQLSGVNTHLSTSRYHNELMHQRLQEQVSRESEQLKADITEYQKKLDHHTVI